jgi:hypothetical protein
MNDIQFLNNGWIMLTDSRETIYIGDVNKWIEDLIIMGITHETIHSAINKLEGKLISDKFDNIFGYADPSILLQPKNNSTFDSTQRDRLERTFWKRRY